MARYDLSDQTRMLREYLGTKVYMASHPKMRSLFRSSARPKNFGDKVWDSTLSLMKHLNDRRIDRAMDLGCGWGILGIHLARRCGTRVTCVDADANLQDVVSLHARLNGVHVEFIPSAFSDLPIPSTGCDLLVGSDVCYSDSVMGELKELIDRASMAEVGEVLIADPGRPDFDRLASHCKSQFRAEVSKIESGSDSKPTLLLSVRF